MHKFPNCTFDSFRNNSEHIVWLDSFSCACHALLSNIFFAYREEFALREWPEGNERKGAREGATQKTVKIAEATHDLFVALL